MIFSIPSRFCGPPGSANGGYVAAKLAAHLSGAVRVRIQSSVPMEVDLAIDDTGGAVGLLANDTVLAKAWPTTIEMAIPENPSFEEADDATSRYVARDEHPFPYCFVCGTARKPGDGMRLFAGPLAGRDVVATPWVPDESLTDESRVPNEFVWAALDCPAYFGSCIHTAPVTSVLGEMSARVDGEIHVGEACVVIGWQLGQEGRKEFVASAVFGQDGTLVAVAQATWIHVKV